MSAVNENASGDANRRSTPDGAFASHAIVNREIYNSLVQAIADRCNACRVGLCRYPQSDAMTDIADTGQCGAFPLILAKHRIDTDA